MSHGTRLMTTHRQIKLENNVTCLLLIIYCLVCAGGQLIVLEKMVPDDQDLCRADSFITLQTILLAASVGGQERSKREYSKLFNAAGLKLRSAVVTRQLYDVIVAARE